MESLFGTDGIRGRANCDPITPEVALSVGKAIALVFGAEGHGSTRAVIGKDTRLSGYMLETALTSGLVSMGMDVFLVGPIPTPAVAHLTRSMCATVGIMLTASHNPYDDNGIKIFARNGFKLEAALEKRIEALVRGGELSSDHVRSANLGKAHRIDDARGRYIEFAKNTVGNLGLDGLKIVLDCANGAAYQIGPWIFQELGAEVVRTAISPDGYNINSNCGALHPEAAAALVREHRANVGIALDGDGDRVVFTDEGGAVVDGDRILAMCGLDFDRRGKLHHRTLAVTVMSNMGLHEAMRRNGIRVVTTEVGDRHVIQRMREDGLNLGGEKAGHVVFMDHVTTGDGIITALQVLRLMREQHQPLSVLATCMEEFPQRLVTLPVLEKKPLADMKAVQDVLSAHRAECGEAGRIVVRYSGTERAIRILVEARDPAGVDAWTARMTSAVERDMKP